MHRPISPSRRNFLRIAAGATAVIGAGGSRFSSVAAAFAPAELPLPPVVVFSKVYQELKLDFEQSALVTAEAGLDGIDCAVRPGGEIPPERAVDDMPRYAAALGKHGVRMMLMTTGILGIDSPHARDVVGAGKKLGIHFYRLGFWQRRQEISADKQIAGIKSSLKDIAAMSQEMGMCALFQNHSSPPNRTDGSVGGDLNELYDIVKDFDPKQLGIAFDLGHAILMHGDGWRQHFEKLKDHIRVVYIKDVRRPATFVPFGEGEFGRTDYFDLLKKMHYDAPLSIHIEYPWAPAGKKTQAALIETLKRNRLVVADWWKHAAAH